MRKHVGVYIIIIILFLTTVISGAAAEIQDMMETMLTGSQSEPVSIVIESPEYLQIAQYEGERVESLNRLMKHFSVCINMDEDVSRTVFSIDKEPFYTIYTYVGENNQTDYEQLPNTLEHIGKQYFETMEAFDPGNQYAVPYFWGTVGILYNTNMVDDPVTSWDILWNPKYKGEILMQDSVRDAFMIPMIRNGFSINTVDPAEVEIATQDLIDQSPLVQAYVVDQVRDKMIGNEAALGVIYSGEALYCQWENPDLEYVVPDEGSLVWFDSWVITKNARNKENALKWIDFLSRPEIALMNFEFITYSVPNETAREMIEDEELRNSEIAFPGEEILNRCFSEEYLGEEGEKLYAEAWKKVKSAN